MTADYRIEARPSAWPADLRDLLAEVETATIGHFEHLGFVGCQVRPVFPSRAIGNAITVAAPGRDGVVIYKAIDLLAPGDILVISRVDHDDIACVGGGVAAAARAQTLQSRARLRGSTSNPMPAAATYTLRSMRSAI